MRRRGRLLAPLAGLAAALMLWWALIRILDVPAYILPSPVAVAAALADGFRDGSLWPHILATVEAATAGLVIGGLLAFMGGVLLAELPVFERVLYPLVSALQAIPKVALAPVILVWFGFGLESRVVLVMLICFFPLFVATMMGIRASDPDLVDLCRASCASRRFVFWHVKLPGAAGGIMVGLQVATSLSLTGAVVGEFVAAQRGLGTLIASASVSMSIATMFGGVFLLAILGIVSTEAVRWLHAKIVFWERPPDLS